MKNKALYYSMLLSVIALPALAQLDIASGRDNSKPIEITADSLEVLQAENKAIFSGDVDAKQGDVDIRSSKMTVFYKKEAAAKKGETKEDLAAKRKTSSESKVSRVQIDNNVFISTPHETAQGDKGVYNVDSGIITLDGNVTLTSGKNIVKGQRLVYNMKTGQSQIVSGVNDKKASGKKERVRGVFIPGK